MKGSCKPQPLTSIVTFVAKTLMGLTVLKIYINVWNIKSSINICTDDRRSPLVVVTCHKTSLTTFNLYYMVKVVCWLLNLNHVVTSCRLSGLTGLAKEKKCQQKLKHLSGCVERGREEVMCIHLPLNI